LGGSLCRKKASDGGDIGCRYTPEMLEILGGKVPGGKVPGPNGVKIRQMLTRLSTEKTA
jgi:hypothetical protein